MKTIVAVKRIFVYVERAAIVDFRPNERAGLGMDVTLLRHYFRLTDELSMHISECRGIHLRYSEIF